MFERCEMGIFNADDPYSLRAMSDAKCKKISISALSNGLITASEIQLNGLEGISYIYRSEVSIFGVESGLPFIHNVYNSLMAIATALYLGLDCETVRRAIRESRGAEGRTDIYSEGDITVIIDYAHTIEAYRSLLKSINMIQKARQKLIIVFGCGGERDESKRPAIAKISEKYADTVIVTSDNPRGESEAKIISEILKGFSTREKVKVVSDREKAINEAICKAESGSIVAVVGKGSEKYLIGKNGYTPYSDRETVIKALRKRKEGCVENKNGDTAENGGA